MFVKVRCVGLFCCRDSDLAIDQICGRGGVFVASVIGEGGEMVSKSLGL